jgi:alkylation response protein AidB-like acyl-CoA dehydrogenase
VSTTKQKVQGYAAPEDIDALRGQVRSFLAEHLPPDWKGIGALPDDEREEFLDDWRALLVERHLLAPSWPVKYGGTGLGFQADVVVVEELSSAGAPTYSMNDQIGLRLLGNTILHLGTEEQKQTYLDRMLRGEDVWCQGFSEPDAGSDLAGLRCRADLDGDEWRINGQKVWTTAGHLANKMFLLARTNQDAPKHRGISMLLVDTRQPGVQMRPIAMISGGHEFNEVFFEDARCPSDAVLGEVDGGWGIAMGLLGFERGEQAATAPAVYREELTRLIAYARERAVLSDPHIRDRIARSEIRVRLLELLGARMVEDVMRGNVPGPEASLFKLAWSQHSQAVTELAVDLLGADAVAPTGREKATPSATDLFGSPSSSQSWVTAFLHARAGTIYAGTSEIQRNTVAKMVLGLPDEPR